MTFKKHNCELDLGSDSMLPKKQTWFGRACRSLRKLGQLSKLHPETFGYFRSHSAVVAERQRQLLEEQGGIIHPFSLLSLTWMCIMIFVNMMHLSLSTFRLVYILEPMDNLRVHTLDKVLLGFHCICLLDIVIKFNTGHVDKKNLTISMDRKLIAIRYLSCWFLVDLVSCLPIACILISLGARPRFILFAHFMPFVRIARMFTVVHDMKTFLRLFTDSYIIHGVVRIAVLYVLSTHICSCLMYLPAAISYYWNSEMPTHYSYFMQIASTFKHILLHDVSVRYNKAIIIVLSAFFGTGFTMFRSIEPDEITIHSFIIVYADMFMVFAIVFLIKSYLTIFGSSMRYHGLMNQVEEYMKYRQFPLALKKRVYAFYEYRYQERYFKEEADLDCLSEELRDEIRLHTCQTLVHKVKLFEGVPASIVGSILGCLRPEVYLSNDLVARAGDIGDCMYFIAYGTVAVFSQKGLEVCHLEDGAFFGAVALMMKDSKRVATVVAVEITQLYRLDASDFNRYVLPHRMLYDRIQQIAAQRMHDTVVLDDEYRREREKFVEQLQSESERPEP